VATLAAGILAAGPASAQDDWDLRFAPYLWASGIDGEASLGPVMGDLDVDFGDILDVLDARCSVTSRRAGPTWASSRTSSISLPNRRIRSSSTRSSSRPGICAPLEGSKSWSDAFIGYRREKAMGESWRSVVRANTGAGGSDLTSAV
jgi:hypothetical protein